MSQQHNNTIDATRQETSLAANHPMPTSEIERSKLIEELNEYISELDGRMHSRYCMYERQIGRLRTANENLLDVLKVVYVTLEARIDSAAINRLQAATSRAIAEADPTWNGLMPDNAEEVMAP